VVCHKFESIAHNLYQRKSGRFGSCRAAFAAGNCGDFKGQQKKPRKNISKKPYGTGFRLFSCRCGKNEPKPRKKAGLNQLT